MVKHSRFALRCITCAAFLFAFSSAAVAAISAADYRESLKEVYGNYQGVLARREACNSAFPQSKGSTEKAINVWLGRHKKLIEELDQRLAVMIRAYSKDEKDYTRNFGKYHGGLLRQREEVKQTLLQQGSGDLEIMCKALPAFLQGADSDLEKEFAEDLRIVRQWQLPPR
jgi:hypothetical protein